MNSAKVVPSKDMKETHRVRIVGHEYRRHGLDAQVLPQSRTELSLGMLTGVVNPDCSTK
jgi:hypothetical protein